MELMHDHQIIRTGKPAESAGKALLMLHGRGATATGILSLADELAVDGFHLLAPQAPNNEWYPFRFVEPVEKNEPWLSKSLKWIEDIIRSLENEGIPHHRIFLLGFSQGACLATEFAARTGGKYGGIFALSGGLIGHEIDKNKYQSGLNGTPVFLGCGDKDHHIPVSRVEETAEVLIRSGANVETRIYEGMEHTIIQDELEYINAVLAGKQ